MAVVPGIYQLRNNHMKKIYQIIAVGFIAVLSACTSDEPATDRDNPRKAVELTVAEKVVSEDMGEFNTALFKAYAANETKGENLIISPLSAAMYLSMQANYCSDETQKQIFKAIGSSDINALNSFNAKMLASLGSLDKTATMSLANAVWYDRKYSLKQGVEDALSSNFNAEFFPCNPSATEIKEMVNGWIKGKTNGKITDFYDGNPFMSMVINALYFNAEWKDKFPTGTGKTKEKFFVGEKIYMVPMMYRDKEPEYLAEGKNFAACRREFGNGAYTCTFILPDEGCDINDFIKDLSYDDIATLEFATKICKLGVPKYEIKGEIDNIHEVFANLGIKGLGTPLDISIKDSSIAVKQETYIKIDEDGAEVAAVIGDDVFISYPVLIPSFILNRPFIFMINETSTNACILMGCIRKFDC